MLKRYRLIGKRVLPTRAIRYTKLGGVGVEFRQIQYFVAVAEERSFRRAAERLNVSQPPLSHQIRKLEEELGFALFIRDSHHVLLTEAGRAYLQEMRPLLSRMQAARQRAQKIDQGAVGTLAIGFLGSTTYQLAPILKAYRTRYPDVALTLLQLKMPEQLQALHEDVIAVGLMRDVPSHPSLASVSLAREPLVAAMPDDHPLAFRGETLGLRDLADEPFVMTPFRAGSSYYNATLACCLAAGFHPKVALQAPEILTIVALVGSGAGVALVPSSFRKVSHAHVVYRDLIDSKAYLSLALVYAKDKRQTVWPFVDIARQVAASLA